MTSQPPSRPPYPPHPQPPPPASGAGAISIAMLAIGCVVAIPVIVAVVGILAAIAIPNFLKFQCKSKQSEAKTNLSGIYVSEKAFYGEYGYYTTDLKALAWSPDGSPLYLYGFAKPGPDDVPDDADLPSDYDDTRSDTSDPYVLGASYSTARQRTLDGSPLRAADFPIDAVVTSESFVAAAIGDIDTDPSYQTDTLDVWTIDENRMLRNVSNDCSR